MTETFTVIISETERYEYMVAKRGKGWHAEWTYHYRYRKLRSDEYDWGEFGSRFGLDARTRKGLYKRIGQHIADKMAEQQDPFRSKLHERMNAPRASASN